jgi:hypothetical protein
LKDNKVYLILGAGLYLILTNSQKEDQNLEIITKTTPPASIELVETEKNKSFDEDKKKEEDEIEDGDEEEERLNK